MRVLDGLQPVSGSVARVQVHVRVVDVVGIIFQALSTGTPFVALPLAPDVVYRLEPGVAPDGSALWACSSAKSYTAVAQRWLGFLSVALYVAVKIPPYPHTRGARTPKHSTPLRDIRDQRLGYSPGVFPT